MCQAMTRDTHVWVSEGLTWSLVQNPLEFLFNEKYSYLYIYVLSIFPCLRVLFIQITCETPAVVTL